MATIVGCVVIAGRRLRRLRRYPRPDPGGRDIRGWLQGLEAGSEAASSLRAIVEAPSRSHGVAEVNEMLREIEHDLSGDRVVASAAARVALFGGWLAAAVELLSAQDVSRVGSAAVAIGVGLVGGGVCMSLGRQAEQQASSLRLHWNRVAGAIERWLDSRVWSIDDQSVDQGLDQR